MRVTWIIPDTYSFLVDELKMLSTKLKGIRVLSGAPIPPDVIRLLGGVDFYHCRECAFLPMLLHFRRADGPLKTHGLQRVFRNRWHMRKVAGIYKVLCRLEKEAPSSIIHSHFAYPGGLGGTLMNSVPQLLTLRGYDILTTGTYGALWNPFFRLNLVNAYRRHGTVTAGSSHSFQRARQILGPDADLRLLLQGIDTATFEPSGAYTRQSLDLPTDGFVFLAVGNLVEVKNHAMLIHALQRVVAQSPRPVHLLICGDGPLGTSLRETTRQLGMEKHVQFMGRLSRRELADIYCLSDIFVHPSLSEGFGNVLLEAMLHRLLIVSSPVGIAPDVIRHGDNGFLPLLGDDRSLAECLLEAMQLLPRFKHAAESNREMVLARFGMEKRIDGYMSLYRELVERHAPTQ